MLTDGWLWKVITENVQQLTFNGPIVQLFLQVIDKNAIALVILGQFVAPLREHVGDDFIENGRVFADHRLLEKDLIQRPPSAAPLFSLPKISEVTVSNV